MNLVAKAWAIFFAVAVMALLCVLALYPDLLLARNITEYKNIISDSAPSVAANHTFSFKLGTSIAPNAYIEITPPVGFEIVDLPHFVAERNVELFVNGIARQSGATAGVTTDGVEIFSGSPGMIRYTLNSTQGIGAGANLQLKIGNHTSKSLVYSVEYSTSTGTTTTEADVKPIINDSTTGTKRFQLEIYDGGMVADAGFVIAVVDQVGLGPADTTEEIPPLRFNGSPNAPITGVTLSVELFLETNELAICKYSLVAGTSYQAMPFTFTGTGLIYHTVVVAVTPATYNEFFIRCIDDEGNFNIDDYVIAFAVSEVPTGQSNTDGDVEGDGTGSGNDGSGSGSGSGGESGDSNGIAPSQGGTSGGGGSGGGGGGGSGSTSGSSGGGGFESTDAPYRSGDGRVIITGYAFPRSEVHVLVDGKVVTNVRAGNDGQYSLTVDQIARGAYTFGLFALDNAKVRSSTFSTSFSVVGARTSALSNINLAPTILVSPNPVNPGQTLTLSGYTQPNALVTLENEKDKSPATKQTIEVTANSDGAWTTTVNTANFSNGTYKVRARSAQAGGVTTNFSNYTLYGVGQEAVKEINADLNRDGKINLIDFSILLFWWNSDGGTSNPSADINGDKKVNLTDFSILLFNWTG
ncbi:MAG TPA: dockerin type I domain-containing protein [Candidatus Paceibacterota bacterium]|mgnify:CR=1 FL=1|nr:dockerin type I domain-containing protein [Candidatus Paceibacterota bacterium]